MRLWSLHPRYLDPQGLVALWREALLARAVLGGKTRGYQNHPQLERFRAHSAPRSAISFYLQGLHAEARVRGYSFDRSKAGRARVHAPLFVTAGQIEYEWQHLLQKLAARSPALYEQWVRSACRNAIRCFRFRRGRLPRGSASGRLNPRARKAFMNLPDGQNPIGVELSGTQLYLRATRVNAVQSVAAIA